MLFGLWLENAKTVEKIEHMLRLLVFLRLLINSIRMARCRYEFVIFCAKVQGDLAAAAAFCASKKSSPPAPLFSIFHISLPAVAFFKCQTPDEHVMEVNLRGEKAFVGSDMVADAGFLAF